MYCDITESARLPRPGVVCVRGYGHPVARDGAGADAAARVPRLRPAFGRRPGAARHPALPAHHGCGGTRLRGHRQLVRGDRRHSGEVVIAPSTRSWGFLPFR